MVDHDSTPTTRTGKVTHYLARPSAGDGGLVELLISGDSSLKLNLSEGIAALESVGIIAAIEWRYVPVDRRIYVEYRRVGIRLQLVRIWREVPAEPTPTPEPAEPTEPAQNGDSSVDPRVQRFVSHIAAQRLSSAEIETVIKALQRRADEIEVNCYVLHVWTNCTARYIAGELARAAAMRITAEILRGMITPITSNAPIMTGIAV